MVVHSLTAFQMEIVEWARLLPPSPGKPNGSLQRREPFGKRMVVWNSGAWRIPGSELPSRLAQGFLATVAGTRSGFQG